MRGGDFCYVCLFPMSEILAKTKICAKETLLRVPLSRWTVLRRREPTLAAKSPHLPQLGEAKPARLVDVVRQGLLYD